jgi:DNA polymerase-3 subunit delta'
MIKEYLTQALDLNKLYNVYLVGVDDVEAARKEIIEFIGKAFYQQQNALSHPDFMLVEKSGNSAKNIAMQQIRELQNFLNKTSIISGYKTAIICGVDQMNLNAANSCLKLLEDTPKNTYVFLITTNAAAILPTIRSRCRKITYNYNSAVLGNFGSKQVDDYYVRPFLKMTKIDEHLSYIKDFSTKDRELWVEFTSNAQNLIARICKNLSGHDIALSPLEKKFLDQIMPVSINYLTNRYDKLVKLTEDTINFDLELRASYILLINIMN